MKRLIKRAEDIQQISVEQFKKEIVKGIQTGELNTLSPLSGQIRCTVGFELPFLYEQITQTMFAMTRKTEHKNLAEAYQQLKSNGQIDQLMRARVNDKVTSKFELTYDQGKLRDPNNSNSKRFVVVCDYEM